MVGSLWQDIRFGARMLLKHPTPSIVSMLIFGLGIGLTTTVFSIVNGAFFKGLPFEEADRLVMLWNTNASKNELDMAVSVLDYVAFRERQTTFEDIGFFRVEPMNLAANPGQPERFTGARISANTLDILRIKPVLGRPFRPGEGLPGVDSTIIISNNIWRDRFGSSVDVLGKTVRVNGVTRTVIGVMPRGFAFPGFESLWLPLEADPLPSGREAGPAYQLFGRLRQGIPLEQARSQVISIAADLERQFPETNKGISATIRPYSENFVKPQLRSALYTMLGAGIGVLLIACINIANLLLVRATMRGREFAIRIAVGARRARILRQLLVEALVLAIPGGILGFWFSTAAMGWFVAALALNPPPFWITFELDYRVMLFVSGITLASGLFAGVIPAWRAGRANTSDELKSESRTSNCRRVVRFSSIFVVAEVAISCALLIAAGMMVRSVSGLRALKLPFEVDRVFTARINLPQADYPDASSRIQFYRQLLSRLRSLPGVEDATLSDRLPAAVSRTVAFQIEGRASVREGDSPAVREEEVSAGYFRTFQVPVLSGREFTERDEPGSPPVAVVNESFARIFLEDGNPIGRRIRKVKADLPSPWLVVVGVVPDLMMEGLGNSGRSPAGFYLPLAQGSAPDSMSIALRTRAEPMRVAYEARSAVASLNRDLPIFGALPMKGVINRQTWIYTVLGTFFLVLGFSALLLALAGLYAVMSFTVTERTREVSIRVALGAERGQLIRLVIRRGIAQLTVGLILGLVLGLLMMIPLGAFLYGVEPHDPTLIGAVIAVLAASGLIANLLPAWRITKINAAASLTTV